MQLHNCYSYWLVSSQSGEAQPWFPTLPYTDAPILTSADKKTAFMEGQPCDGAWHTKIEKKQLKRKDKLENSDTFLLE